MSFKRGLNGGVLRVKPEKVPWFVDVLVTLIYILIISLTAGV
jgi:hypothetical protein